MKRIRIFLTLSCEKAASLIDKKHLLGLTPKEKVMLKLHTAMCDACAAYDNQSRFIDGLLDRHLHQEENVPLLENKELKNKIISGL